MSWSCLTMSNSSWRITSLMENCFLGGTTAYMRLLGRVPVTRLPRCVTVAHLVGHHAHLAVTTMTTMPTETTLTTLTTDLVVSSPRLLCLTPSNSTTVSAGRTPSEQSLR